MPDSHDNSARPFTIFNSLTRDELSRKWQGIKQLARQALSKKKPSSVQYENKEDLKELISECINARGGDVSARIRTVELGTVYLGLSKVGRENFHNILARDFDVNAALLDQSITSLGAAVSVEDRIKAEIALKNSLIPSRVQLLKQFSSLPNGFKFLIDMRADLLSKTKEDPYICKLANDLKEILDSWFDVGLLDLTEITWDSPAALLEKLIEYEAVHEIRSWNDLRKRLDSDRLCFAFLHNKMPREPIIFVEVALVDNLSDNIQKLICREGGSSREHGANTAIFYSISNAQPGLAGISLGNFLIKTVVKKLAKEKSHLKHFATLSPVPGFRKWLDSLLADKDENVLCVQDAKAVKNQYACDNGAEKLQDLLAGDWFSDEETANFLKPILLNLCARYLLHEKKENKALDPVMNFHLTNGARIERVNWLADLSDRGMKRSYGIMVNYYYELSDIDSNHEQYISSTLIAASREVKKIFRE
ncbi:MAG: malonyl-CoA decarboxylase [Desulfobulbaceae bacterium]|uniref:Malonyl-CoA decarboxylase n=1 Tax=Candidatus Desulfobia pelagia TaxID=2841692 RepID=A0A8J6NDH3_9BACT|nr:malonyl-CoA decarboxylase [Candidatus Desulfobia pelagia]